MKLTRLPCLMWPYHGADNQSSEASHPHPLWRPRPRPRSRADRLGQLGLGIDDVGQVGVIAVPRSDPAARWRNRRLSEGGRSRSRQRCRWNSPSSLYPLTTSAPSGGTGRVKVRRAHRNGQSPGHDSRLRTSVYGIQPSEGNGEPAPILRAILVEGGQSRRGSPLPGRGPEGRIATENRARRLSRDAKRASFHGPPRG